MKKKETIKFTITVDPEIEKKLNEGSYNCNKLVNELLKKYLEKKQK
jgi:hypothetical protein